MKSFRVLDDNIMLRLNETNTHAEASCASFFNELVAAYEKRDASIKFCLDTMDKNIATKKDKLFQDPDDYTLKDSIMTDESKRQIIANESVVEDIVRGRSLKAFQEKCAMFDLPENIQEFLDQRHGNQHAPVQVEQALFESVGEGVAYRALGIPAQDCSSPSGSSATLNCSESLAACSDLIMPPSARVARDARLPSQVDGVAWGYRDMGEAMDTLRTHNDAKDHNQDRKAHHNENSTVFNTILNGGNRAAQSLREDMSFLPWPLSSDQASLGQVASPDPPSLMPAKRSANVLLELPPLSKRPRDILNGCRGQEGASAEASTWGSITPLTATLRENMSRKVLTVDVTADVKKGRMDTWWAAGKPLRQDATSGEGKNEDASRNPTSFLTNFEPTWETYQRLGSIAQPRDSPYVTDAETRVFEAVYKKHSNCAFKFRPAPANVSYESLIECIFLLLSGTPSSLFTFNLESAKFEMDNEGVRIEGCSAAGVYNLLQDMLRLGTHMRRLVKVADTCIHHPEGMGLIRIAFGRSLSSYLTFLQGTIVTLENTSRSKRVHVLELHHKTRNLGAILEKLAHLCRCHGRTCIPGFEVYLPAGPDLLTLLYDEVLESSSTSDPLWAGLLLSLFDQASKPYLDIMSRWMGVTGHDQIEPIPPIGQDQEPSEGFSDSCLKEDPTRQNYSFSVFGSLLQQSLHGLDPFGEFFVHSKHGWSWDGSGAIVLAEPLDYDAEFQTSDTIRPPRFIQEELARQIIEAGKELQILLEFDPRHPLLARGGTLSHMSYGFRWFYSHKDVIEHNECCQEATKEILGALAAKLEETGWTSRRSTLTAFRRGGKQRQSRTEIFKDTALQDIKQQDAHGVGVDEDHTQGQALHQNAWAARHLSLDPGLRELFCLASAAQTYDISLACPNMLAFLLGTGAPSFSCSSPADFNTPLPPSSSMVVDHSMEVSSSDRTRLEEMTPMQMLVEQSLHQSVWTRASLINTCALSMYFHDLNLLGHLEIIWRFLLMSDGNFVARLAESLFDDAAGLLTRSARAAMETSVTQTTRDDGVLGVPDDTQGPFTVSTVRAWRTYRQIWPPRSGELEMALRAVLLDCFQPVKDPERDSKHKTLLDSSDMDVEEDAIQQTRAGVDGSRMKRGIDPQALEKSLAFAVKEYDDETKISSNSNALEALDFLYLDYKAPQPLRLLFFTPDAFHKYSRLFTLKLRLARVDATLKQVYLHLRAREKALRSCSTASVGKTARTWQEHQHQQQQQQQQEQDTTVEMRMLHQFRFEAQQIFDGFQGYITDIAIGATWMAFIQQMGDVQTHIEEVIFGADSGPACEDGRTEGIDVDGTQEKQLDELSNLAALHHLHNHMLDQMLLRSLLKRKQAPILNIVYGILNCILKLWQYVNRLPEAARSEEDAKAQELQERRLPKLKSLHDKFRSLSRMLLKVLQALNERNMGLSGTSLSTEGNATAGSSDASGGFLQMLLLRLDTLSWSDE